jgi:hypothetical protein
MNRSAQGGQGRVCTAETKAFSFTHRTKVFARHGAWIHQGSRNRLPVVSHVLEPFCKFVIAHLNPLQEVLRDEMFARTDSVGTRVFLSDGIGSTLALTDKKHFATECPHRHKLCIFECPRSLCQIADRWPAILWWAFSTGRMLSVS